MTDIEVESVMNYLSANFFKRLVKEAQGEYRTFLRSAGDIKIMKKVIDIYAAKDQMPTLYHLRKSYKEALLAKNPMIAPKAKNACSHCNFSGLRTVIFQGFSIDCRKLGVKSKPLNFPWQYEQLIPCNCERGRYFRANSESLKGLSDAGHARIMEHCAFDTANETIQYFQECRKLPELSADDKDAILFLNRTEEVKEEQQKELDIF